MKFQSEYNKWAEGQPWLIMDDKGRAGIEDRWNKAEVIYQGNGVRTISQDQYKVMSQGQTEKDYLVFVNTFEGESIGCECVDYRQSLEKNVKGAPGSWCKHRLAAWLHRERTRNQGSRTRLTPQPIKETNQMQEAQSSINFRMLLNGVDCQFTVRGADEYETLARARQLIATVLGQYPQEAPSEPAPVQVNPAPPATSPTTARQPKQAGNGARPQSRKPVCQECGATAVWKEGVSQRTQREYKFWKCEPCDEILTVDGAFKRSKSAA